MGKQEKQMTGDALQFAKEMKFLINNKDTSDIKFLIGPNRKAIHAHRCILAARCEVFKAMILDQSTQKKDGSVPLVLSDIDPEIFTAMIEFIYTNCCTLNPPIVVDVLATSIEYGLDGLKELCVQYLTENLSKNTACEAMQAAVTYGLGDLRRESLTYIEQNTQDVFQTKSFTEMSESALASVLQSDDLMIDESELIKAVREWATVNAAVLNKSVSQVSKKVVQHIRLPLLSPEELQDVEANNKKSKMIPVEQISFAWKCHALKQTKNDDPVTQRRAGTMDRDSH